jgi:hypothetical protein
MGNLKSRVKALSHADRRKLIKVLWASTVAEGEELGKANAGAYVVRWQTRSEHEAWRQAQGLPVPVQGGCDDNE